MTKFSPILENQNKGFHYTVTEEQIKEHQKRTVKEIFQWLETTNKFISKIQTSEEKTRSQLAKTIETLD